MAGLGTLLKMARGGVGVDELAEILSAMGIDMEITPLPRPEGQIDELTNLASIPDSKAVLLSGRMKGGERIRAVLILSPPQKVI
jgi:hypothetical protein